MATIPTDMVGRFFLIRCDGFGGITKRDSHMSNPQAPPIATPTSAEDIKKAQAFFDRAATVGQTGNHEYAVDMYVQGLMLHPEAMDTYKALRQIAMVRSAEGGKDIGYFEKRK